MKVNVKFCFLEKKTLEFPYILVYNKKFVKNKADYSNIHLVWGGDVLRESNYNHCSDYIKYTITIITAVLCLKSMKLSAMSAFTWS